MSTQIIYYAEFMNLLLYSFIGVWKADRVALQRCFARRKRSKRVQDFQNLRNNYNNDVKKLRNKYGPEIDAVVREISTLNKACE